MRGRRRGQDDPWSWLEPPAPDPDLHLVPGSALGSDPDTEDEDEARDDAGPATQGRWLVALPSTPEVPDTGTDPARRNGGGHRLPGRTWGLLAATAAVLIGIAAVWGTTARDAGQPVRATASAAASATSTEGACTGLSGTVVTNRPGDPATVSGVIASFEAAYFIERSAEAAMRLLAPESGIAADGLAAGIASIPAGSTHCVAVTPISETTANVHVVELHPDRQRVDYLQLINTRPGEGGRLLISNIQRQG